MNDLPVSKRLRIRKMTYDDLDVMVTWLNDPRVLAFYEEPPSDFDRVTRKYGPRIDGNHDVTPCIVEYDDVPIGYLQYYKMQADALKSLDYPSPGNQLLYGIDQFIGEPALWGKGIGTEMIRMTLSYLEKQGVSKVLLDVKKSNGRAIRSYEKCGFTPVKELDNEFMLMEWTSHN